MPLSVDRRSLLFGALAVSVAPLRAAARPNILLLVADGLRFDAIHALGNKTVLTPVLDRFSKQSVTLTNAFVANPELASSRACLATGLDDWTTRVRKRGDSLRPDLPLLPEVLEAQGYDTFFTGKLENPITPERRGFVKTGSVVQSGVTPGAGSGGGTGKNPGLSSEVFAEAFIEYLGSEPPQPFFATIAFTAPREQLAAPAAWSARYEPSRMPLPDNFMPEPPFDTGALDAPGESAPPPPRTKEAVRAEIARYYGMVSHLDAQIGRILVELDKRGLGENSIVVLTSNAGAALGSHGLLGSASLYDHSVRVPLMVRLPDNRLSGRKVHALCYAHQMFGTVCDLARVRAPSDVAAGSLSEVIEEEKRGQETVFASYGDAQRMVTNGRWKLIWYPKAGKWQLFNAESDPDEMRDLSADNRRSSALHQMTALLAGHMKRAGDPLAPSFKAL